jgi:predicted phosphodiesterase
LLRLLHISDIHFKKPYCLDRRKDLDWGVRDCLIEDAKAIAKNTHKPFDAILITGDIAYHGDREEFSVATDWLEEITKDLGLHPEDIYVVPGNHDVNRTTTRDFMTSAAREKILAKKGNLRHTEFLNALDDNTVCQVLMKPMEEYNHFAAAYGCALTLGNAHWEHKLKIDEKYLLCINGLSSTFFSGDDDAENCLYMGAFQSHLRLQDGVVHLAMFHHPFNWLSDGSEIEDALIDKAPLRLVGHMHKQTVRMGQDGTTVYAGATNPDRGDEKWSPGYNIIDISVREERGKAYLDTDIHQRLHQDNPELFIARQTKSRKDTHFNSIEIPLAPERRQIKKLPNEPNQENNSESDEVIAMSSSNRNLVYRFWKLSESQRREIVNEFELLGEEQLTLPETDRYCFAMREVKNRGLVDKFAEKIEIMEKS